MSFGFGVGDFIAVGELAFKLYNECYKIARGAPEGFRLLVNELTSLYASIQILQQALADPKSTLRQAGQERVQSVKNLETAIGDTLSRLEKIARKYEILGAASEKKHYWTRFKWSIEYRDIDGLRAKLVQHNTMLNLLLTAVGNSSLQRIEASNAAMEKELKAIKSHIRGESIASNLPSNSVTLSATDNDDFNETLKAALTKAAEVVQPWSTIGIDQWLEAGRWWLQLAQMDLPSGTQPDQSISLPAYANLVKSTWILLDIITSHPQVPFLTATAQAEIRQFAAEIRTEYARLSGLGVALPDMSQLDLHNLQIWEISNKSSLLRPRNYAQKQSYLSVEGGERVIFQSFANIKLPTRSGRLPCILSVLVQGDLHSARILAQDQNGSTVLVYLVERRSLIERRIFANLSRENCVSIEQDEFQFRNVLDAQNFECSVNAVDFLLHDRRTDKGTLLDLEAYVLIYAVQSEYSDVVEKLSNRLNTRATPTEVSGNRHGLSEHSKSTFSLNGLGNGFHDHNQNDYSDTAPSIALALADSYMKLGPQAPLIDVSTTISLVRIFDWAFRCGHTALVALMLSEDAAWGLSQPWNNCELNYQDEAEDWPSARMRISSGTEGLLELVDQWEDKDLSRAVLASSYRSEDQVQYRCMTILYAAEKGLSSVVRLALLDLEWDHELYRKLLVEAVRRGCKKRHKDFVRSLIQFVCKQSLVPEVENLLLKQALESDALFIEDLVVKGNVATRGPLVDGMTLAQWASNSQDIEMYWTRKIWRKVLTMSFEVKGVNALSALSHGRAKGTIFFELGNEDIKFLSNNTKMETILEAKEYHCDGSKDFVVVSPAVLLPLLGSSTGSIAANHEKSDPPRITFSITIWFYGRSTVQDRELLNDYGFLLADLFKIVGSTPDRLPMELPSLKHAFLENGRFDVPSREHFESHLEAIELSTTLSTTPLPQLLWKGAQGIYTAMTDLD